MLELRDEYMARNSIASTRNMSRTSVSEVFHVTDEKQIRYDNVKDMSEEEVYQLFFPDKCTNLKQFYELSDYEHVHAELKKVGVTLKLLWKEYQSSYKSRGSIPVGYSKFCNDYRNYVSTKALTNHRIHKPWYSL